LLYLATPLTFNPLPPTEGLPWDENSALLSTDGLDTKME